MAGTTPWGGVIAVAGDDHISKSSTAAHQSDHIFKACGTPVFFPASVQEILDLGIHAFAMSRFSGVWAGMKTIQEIVESSATAMIDPSACRSRSRPISRCPPAACTSAGPTMRSTRKRACSITSGMPRWPTSAPTA
jgi:indolepyruvate ferredoxin oxidoreductase